LEIAATSDRPLATLRRVYRYFLIEKQDAPAPSAHLLLLESGSPEAEAVARSLDRTRPDRRLDGHLLIASWLPYALRIETPALLHYYTSKLTRLWVVERSDQVTATFHAAALIHPGGAGFLLIGEAAVGKTTMALRLLDEGFTYCADDTACVRRRDLVCVPFPMAFVLRNEPAAVRRRDAAFRATPPDIALLDEPRWLAERWDAVGNPFKPEALYFLGSDPALAPGELRPMRPADAALLLIRNLVMPLGADADSVAVAPHNFDLACRLAETARASAVNTTNLDRALAAIRGDLDANVPGLMKAAV